MPGAPRRRPSYEKKFTHPTNEHCCVSLQLILIITISKNRVYSAYCDQTVVCKLPVVEMSDFHFSCLWPKRYLKKKKKKMSEPALC